jgi:hypothetical protein
MEFVTKDELEQELYLLKTKLDAKTNKNIWTITSLVDDDFAMTTPPYSVGCLVFMTAQTAGIAYNAVIFYRVTATHTINKLGGHADIEVTTGALNGTTGNDNKITISVNSANGKVYVENRSASTLTFQIQFLY